MNYQSKVFNTENKIKRAIKLAKTGIYSAPRLAVIFDCDKKTVFRILKVNKINLPNLGQFTKRIFADDNFFINLSPVSAYWLGFVAADGTLSERDKSVAIALNKRDAGHLYKFIKAVNTNAKVGYIKSNNSVRVSIYSKLLFNSLTRLGIKPNKSLTITNVNLPASLMPHFIRGVFDGDGWISGTKVTHIQFGIAGNKPFLQRIQDVLINSCGVNKVKIYHLTGANKAYKLQYTGSQIFKILNFLYKNSNNQLRLQRKYQKALAMGKQFGNNDTYFN